VTIALKRLGRYDLIRQLATGGMAEIYLAAARGVEGCDKLVVIKRMLPTLAVDAEYVSMFLDEARLIAQLSHSNIVQFHDVEARDGEYFIVMELLRGGDVLQLLKATIARPRLFPLDAALVIVLGLCAALHYAHEKNGSDGKPLGIVHRDISPANVFVTFAGGVKLLDFGVARAEGRSAKTRFGVIKGKLSYSSPEQARGEVVDRRSDIFSLSTLLWELTTQIKLFRGANDYEVLQSVLDRDAPRPSDVHPDYPRELERIVMKGLRRDPRERYQTAQELQIDLEQFALDHKVSISPRAAANLVADLLSKDSSAFRLVQPPAGGGDDPVTVAQPYVSRAGIDDSPTPVRIVRPLRRSVRWRARLAVATALVLCAASLALWRRKDGRDPTTAPRVTIAEPRRAIEVTFVGPPAPPPIDKIASPVRAAVKPKRRVTARPAPTASNNKPATSVDPATTPNEEDDNAPLPP